jgi:alpha-L-fucosidase
MMIRRFNDGRDWMFKKRLGLFLHWGLYSIPAVHEQMLWRYHMSRGEYEALQEQFNPVDYDPDAWLDLAQEAGMEFVCITTKHHDGFCMWDTKETDYNIMNTPHGKDVIKMLADACARRGMDLGFYYSLPDWHHPNYPNLGRHHELSWLREDDDIDEEKYLQYVEKQIRELLTQYGKITHLFWDINVAKFHKPAMNEMVRELQPGILINDRGPGEGDYVTPEREVPEGRCFQKPTIAIQSTGRESWCYRENEDYYTHLFLMQSIGKTLAMGGSYSLNVGPDASGRIGVEDKETLAVIGSWYKRVREAYTDTIPCSHMLSTVGNVSSYDPVFLTRKQNIIYVSACETLHTSGIMLNPIDRLPERASLLNDGRAVECVVDVTPWRWKGRPALRLANLPVNEFPAEPLVVKLEFAADQ